MGEVSYIWIEAEARDVASVLRATVFEQEVALGRVRERVFFGLEEVEPVRLFTFRSSGVLGVRGQLELKPFDPRTEVVCRVISYQPPGGRFVGWLLDRLVLRRKLEEAYGEALEELKALVEGNR